MASFWEAIFFGAPGRTYLLGGASFLWNPMTADISLNARIEAVSGGYKESVRQSVGKANHDFNRYKMRGNHPESIQGPIKLKPGTCIS